MSDFSQLRSFVAVAQYQSISRAAEAVHLTQPAVSLQIKQLETSLGTALFHRHPIRLTDAGQHLLVQAQAILAQWEATVDYVQAEQSLERGQLTLTCSDTLMRFALLPMITAFRSHYPGIQLSFLNRTSTGAVTDVVEGRADLALALAADPHPKLRHQTVLNYEDVLVVPSDHKLSTKSQIRPADLSGETLLLLEERTTSRHLIEAWLTTQPAVDLQRMSLGSVDAQLALTDARLGLGIVPDFAAPRSLTPVRLQGLPPRTIVASYRQPKPAVTAWLALMADQAESQGSDRES